MSFEDDYICYPIQTRIMMMKDIIITNKYHYRNDDIGEFCR